MSFKENLREALDYSGIGQKELARKANISLRNIENYLRENASIPSADKAVQIAHVLGVTVEYLVTGNNTEKKNSTSIIEPEIDHETRQLIRAIKILPAAKRRIVINNALYLTKILKDQ